MDRDGAAAIFITGLETAFADAGAVVMVFGAFVRMLEIAGQKFNLFMLPELVVGVGVIVTQGLCLFRRGALPLVQAARLAAEILRFAALVGAKAAARRIGRGVGRAFGGGAAGAKRREKAENQKVGQAHGGNLPFPRR